MKRLKEDIIVASNLAVGISSVIGVVGASGYYMTQATSLKNQEIILLMSSLFVILMILVLMPIVIK